MPSSDSSIVLSLTQVRVSLIAIGESQKRDVEVDLRIWVVVGMEVWKVRSSMIYCQHAGVRLVSIELQR